MTIEHPIPISPETPITVTLQAHEWNTVIAVLSDAPYKIVANIIAKTASQMQAGATQALAENPPARPNGEDSAIPGAFR